MNPTDDPNHPAESKSTESGISPAVRRKLEAEYDEDEELVDDDAKANNLLALGLFVVILAIGGVVAFSMSRTKNVREEGAPAETSEATALADSAASDTSSAAADTAGTPGASTTPPAGSASASATQPAETKPAPVPAKPAATASKPAGSSSTPAATPAAEAPAKVGHFGIAVATFINEDRAKSELARLGTATSLEGTVITVKEDGGDAFRVVLGDFPSRADAEKKADELASGATVREARVVALKK